MKLKTLRIRDEFSRGLVVRSSAFALSLLSPVLLTAPTAPAEEARPTDAGPRLAFIGLHGGVFDALKQLAPATGVQVEFITDEQIATGSVDFSGRRMVFLQHVREEDREQYARLLGSAKSADPDLRIISISPISGGVLGELAQRKIVEHDPELSKYYGSSVENLRLLLRYVGVKYLGQSGEIPLPLEDQEPHGLYHPDAPELFANVPDYVAWAAANGRKTAGVGRVIVTVHSTHLVFQQPQVVAALVREFEKRGILVVAMVDGAPEYLDWAKEFKPQVVVHTCHSRESAAWREELEAVHLHSIFFRKQSIDDWRPGVEGLASSELAFHVIGQELLGAIEPQVGAGTQLGGGSNEAFTPIPERIDHLVDRAAKWIELARLDNRDKKIAVVYYDRELGKSELMRGSATGMFMNGPRSLVNVLKAMDAQDYRLRRVPQDEDDLLLYMQDHGRQIGVWAPGVLDKLARSGKAVLIPAEQYRQWFDAKVPEPQRKAVIDRWGPPPGKFLTWESDGKQFIVVPRADLGNVILLPQPLRGEAHDTSLLHDKLIPPPHNYLATYFWLQEEFGANALIHFGTHGSEFALPGKPSGLSDFDWPDVVLGNMPNINPWIINNLGESSPVRRRAYGVLINHLTPPLVNAELSDELQNLHNDIDHWVVLSEGPLKAKFAKSITEQVRAQRLDTEVKLPPADDPKQPLTGPQIEKVLEYLHDIHNETTPVNLHVFGEPPRDDLLIPYLVTCLRTRFQESLGEIVDVPAGEALNPGDRLKYLRRTAEEAIGLMIRQGYSPEEAVIAAAGLEPTVQLPSGVQEGCRLAARLADGFKRTPQEIDNLLRALDGRFVPPGPGNSPDRNPSVVPTGRNMFLLNPEEVPSRPSWELGCEMVDQLLKDQLASKGRYPERVGFSLSCFATFQDFGVMESQILHLLGVRPVWDDENLVTDVELVPLAELKRPRIDVFIAGQSYYRDLLPSRMRLIDKAVRLVAAADEESENDNLVLRNSRRVARELLDRKIPDDQAEKLSRARIFGHPPGQNGSASYYYLVERSGHWDSREELAEAYLAQNQYAYTDGMWGEEASAAYDRQIQGTEVVMRSWSDSTTSPLSNKYTWYQGGSLCRAVEHLTGKAPEFILSDLRDADDAQLISAEDALRKDYRVRLFNRKWIEGMMKEGYAGADQISVHVSNTMGWEIMRPESVSDEMWEEIVDVFVRDSKHLAIREWFESENPFALQEMNEVMLEAIRKEYWNASETTRREIAEAYAQSVARHGEGGGLRGGGNVKLETFVKQVLEAAPHGANASLVAAYEAKARESVEIATPPAAADGVGENSESASTASVSTSAPAVEERRAAAAKAKTERVSGRTLKESSDVAANDASSPSTTAQKWRGWIVAALCAALVAGGYFWRLQRSTW